MTPSRAAALENEDKRDTIPAPPPSAASVSGPDATLTDATGPNAAIDADAPESRVASRRRDTVPAPAAVPSFEDEPVTDRTPAQTHDSV